jgi:hypothetical protein
VIKMLKEDGPNGCPLVMLGLSHGNLDKLRAGSPILLDIDQCAMLGLGQRELMIYSGTDEIAMAREVESHGLIPEGSADKLAEEFAKREHRQRRPEP